MYNSNVTGFCFSQRYIYIYRERERGGEFESEGKGDENWVIMYYIYRHHSNVHKSGFRCLSSAFISCSSQSKVLSVNFERNG